MQRWIARFVAAAALAAVMVPTPARAASKEIVELQTQVQQLLDMVQRLQSTVDARFGAMQHLVEQTADNASQVTLAVNAIQQKINAQSEATTGKLDTTSGQIQSLNDSVDELKSRIGKLDKSIQELQTQLQNIQNPPPGSMPNTGGAPGAATGMGAPPAPQAPPLKETFQSAMRDFNAAKYDIAASEFQDVMHYYPNDDAAGTSQFYLGEIAYRQQNYADAVKAYSDVMDTYDGNIKVPAAQLHKGLALLKLNKKDAGVRELRMLIQRHPQTNEAQQARSKLNELGVRITAAR